MKLFSILTLLALSSTTFAVTPNTMLQFTMKSISKDISYVSVPTKAESPTEVTEEELVIAIARARTAAFQLRMILDRKDSEFTPSVVQDLPETEKNAKLGIYAEHLEKAIAQVNIAENQLLVERAKNDPASRNFNALASTLKELNRRIIEAHQAFKK